MRHVASHLLARARDLDHYAAHSGVEAPDETQRQLSDLIANLPGIVYRCSVDAPRRMTFVSPGVELLTGHTAAEVTHPGFTWASIVRPEDLPRIDEEVAASLRSRGTYSLYYRIIDGQGQGRWVSERGQPIFGPGGDPLFLEGFITDVTEPKAAEAEAVATSERLGSTLDCVPQMLWSVGADGVSDYYRNKQWYDFTAWQGERSSFAEWQQLIHSDDRERVASTWANSLATGAPYEAEYRLRHCSGEFRWVSSTGVLENDTQGNPTRWYGTCSDIHDRVLAERSAEASDALTHGIAEASPDCLSLLDIDGTVLLVNRATVAAYGVADETQLIGGRWGSRISDEYQHLFRSLLRSARGGEAGRATVHITTPGACIRWWDMVVAPVTDSHGEVIRIAVTSRDITDQKHAQEEALWAAMHDPLTRLPNRSLLEKKLDDAIKRARETGGCFTLLLLDIDHFKLINDALGHAAGDKLLRAFAERLGETVDPKNLVARLAGDEFAVLVYDVDNEPDLTRVIERILSAVAQPVEYEGRLFDTGASIGASRYPNEGTTRATLLKNADLALYSAKKAGRGTWALFASSMRAEVKQRSSMLMLAKEALKQRRILPHYQPKIEMASGNLAGMEALLRWRHPRKGIQTCETIAAAFEDFNVAQQITAAMLDAVIADIRRWQELGFEFQHVAINAAAGDFRRTDFAEQILERLSRASIPTCCLQVEVTETVFLGRGAECVEAALKTLSTSGVKIALDDFGTGYASLSHLKQFPIHILKIDQSFVRCLEDASEDAAIIGAVVDLGRSLGMSVVAEGVETAAQHHALRQLGCRYGQGFLYGKARPAQHLERQFGSSAQ